jgi:hypothetical protein
MSLPFFLFFLNKKLGLEEILRNTELFNKYLNYVVSQQSSLCLLLFKYYNGLLTIIHHLLSINLPYLCLP